MAMLSFSKRKRDLPGTSGSYKILIVDDEEDIHQMTKAILKDFVFENKKLEFLSAYTGDQAIEILKDNHDIAMILLDIVMETEDAGLQVARRVREELKNQFVRIVLRTGHPGQAPEEEVIVKYDINDYKEKTELTSKKLFTLMYSSLRSYRDIIELERSRHYLAAVLDATGAIILILDCEGRIKNVNATAEKVTRYSIEELRDKYLWDLMPVPEESKNIREMFEQAERKPLGSVFKTTIFTKDKSKQIVLWTHTALQVGGESGFIILSGIELKTSP